MSNIECPSCNKETITFKQKILANKWVDIYCSNCGARFCAQPLILALMWFALTWNFIYFGYLTVREDGIVFPILFFSGWLLVETFMYYIPLTRLRAKESPKPSSE